MNILIPTVPDDSHAIFVKLALEKKGHHCHLWYTADFPSLQTHSFEIIDKEIVWQANGNDLDINKKFDTVWYRRPKKPVLPEFLHPDDKKNAYKENLSIFHSFWHLIAENAFWVNPPQAAQAANCKLLQLKHAVQVGLKIPKTLASNDPAKIKNFITTNSANGSVYKSFLPMTWTSEHSLRLTYTKNITLEDLPSDRMLQSTPGIFQEKIAKDFELRVTFFGTNHIAVKINSQSHPNGATDWRSIPTHELSLELFVIPSKIEQQCQALMKRLGLVFGCFDFIITNDGCYYFLEINEQGQFLWIEDVNPQVPMLDTFINFLTSINEAAEFKKPGSLSLSDFKKEACAFKDYAVKNHVEIQDV